MDGRPLFSIVTPVYAPPLDVLEDTIKSVLAQTFEDWEFILVDDLSPDEGVRTLLRRYAAMDPRIRVIERETNGHIVAASNDGIAAARGEFIALLDHDDLLVPEALQANAEVLREDPAIDYVYSDEDKTADGVTFYDEFLKPDWSPERLRSQNYCCHFSVLRTSLVREVGGFRQGYDGSQDHDLILRVTERARAIHHIPDILYHWRVIPGSAAGELEAKPYAVEAGRRAVADQMERLGIAATVEAIWPGMYRVERALSAEVSVSIVITTEGADGLVRGRRRVHVVEAVRSALARTAHEKVEVVVVHDAAMRGSVASQLAEVAGDRLVLVPVGEPLHRSRWTNFGVLASTGDRIVLLDERVELTSDAWLETLLAPLDDTAVGITGAKLLHSDGTVAHAGVAGAHGHFGGVYRFRPGDAPGRFGDLWVSREVSAVAGACLAVRRETYLAVGGATETLHNRLYDVDLCLKVRAAGHAVLYVPAAEGLHTPPLDEEHAADQVARGPLRARWGRPTRDPYTDVREADWGTLRHRR